MIEALLRAIQAQLNDYLQLRAGGPDDEPMIVVEDITRKEQPDEAGEVDVNDKIVLTLVNVEEDPSLKNNYPVRQVEGAFIQEKSAIYLNVYLLLSASHSNYFEAIRQLGRVIEFFQANRTFEFFTTQRCEARINLHNIGFENLNNLWTVIGGHYFPSVMYQARVLLVQADSPASGAAITEILSNETVN